MIFPTKGNLTIIIMHHEANAAALFLRNRSATRLFSLCTLSTFCVAASPVSSRTFPQPCKSGSKKKVQNSRQCAMINPRHQNRGSPYAVNVSPPSDTAHIARRMRHVHSCVCEKRGKKNKCVQVYPQDSRTLVLLKVRYSFQRVERS